MGFSVSISPSCHLTSATLHVQTVPQPTVSPFKLSEAPIHLRRQMIPMQISILTTSLNRYFTNRLLQPIRTLPRHQPTYLALSQSHLSVTPTTHTHLLSPTPKSPEWVTTISHNHKTIRITIPSTDNHRTHLFTSNLLLLRQFRTPPPHPHREHTTTTADQSNPFHRPTICHTNALSLPTTTSANQITRKSTIHRPPSDPPSTRPLHLHPLHQPLATQTVHTAVMNTTQRVGIRT